MKFSKIFSLLVSILIVMLILFGYIEADLLFSVNSGGSTNITINPNSFIGQPFYAANQPPTTPPVSPPPTQPPQPPLVITQNITVNPALFNLNMVINSNLQKTISVTNLGSSSVVVNISQTGLNNMIIIENSSILLTPGQTENVNVVFVAPNATGVYNGSINVGNVIIPVSLNVQTKLLLFDSNIVVLNPNYQVIRGTPLQTQVTLIPMGVNVRTDVTLVYAVKDYNGTIYLTRSETLLVTNQISIRRDFDTGSLPLGKYTVSLQLIYSNGVAPSSANFEVVNNTANFFSLLVYYFVVAIVVVSMLIIIVIIIRISLKYRNNNKAIVSSY